MSKKFKKIMLASVAMSLACQANPAFAQSSSIETRLQAVDARLQALEAENLRLRSELAQTEMTVSKIETVDRATVEKVSSEKAAASNGFKVGNSTLKFGGFVDLDVHFTKTSDAEISTGLSGAGRDQFIPSLSQYILCNFVRFGNVHSNPLPTLLIHEHRTPRALLTIIDI